MSKSDDAKNGWNWSYIVLKLILIASLQQHMALFQSMYQQPDKQHKTFVACKCTSSHTLSLSLSLSLPLARSLSIFVRCNTMHEDRHYLDTSLIVSGDAQNFKNINTFKIDNDDDKRLRDRRTRNTQVSNSKSWRWNED